MTEKISKSQSESGKEKVKNIFEEKKAKSETRGQLFDHRKEVGVEKVFENVDFSEPGVDFYLDELSPEEGQRIIDLHEKNPLIKRLLDEMDESLKERGEAFVIGGAPGLLEASNQRTDSWNFCDLSVSMDDLAGLKYDSKIQKILRRKGLKIPGILYDEGVKDSDVLHCVYLQYIGFKLREEFGDKYEMFEEYALVQLENDVIDAVVGQFRGRDYIHWGKMVRDINYYMNEKGFWYMDGEDKLFSDYKKQILDGNPELKERFKDVKRYEDQILKGNFELQYKLEELFVEKIAALLELDVEDVPLVIKYEETVVVDYRKEPENRVVHVTMPKFFFVKKNTEKSAIEEKD